MSNVIQSIPTMYAGVQFRSRLEAKWAAFFDLCGWRWEYEPFDLPGYIPDFAIIGESSTTLIDVKPSMTKDELSSRAVLLRGNHDGHIFLCLGACMFTGSVIGRFGFLLLEGAEIEASDAFLVKCQKCKKAKLGFNHKMSLYTTESTNCGCETSDLRSLSCEHYTHETWAMAGNTVQWNARNPLAPTRCKP